MEIKSKIAMQGFNQIKGHWKSHGSKLNGRAIKPWKALYSSYYQRRYVGKGKKIYRRKQYDQKM